MYCNNCGEKLPDGTRFCPNCGAGTDSVAKPVQPQQVPAAQQAYGTQPYYPPVTPYKAKEPILALVLSWFVLMGSGHIYAGKPGKGVGLMVGGLVCGGMTYGGIFMMIGFLPFGVAIALLVIGGIALVVIALYSHIDAYSTAKKYNQFLQTHGRPPTSNDTW